MVSAAMDQTVITSCSKGKLLSGWRGIFYHGREVCLCKKTQKNEAEQTGEGSMKKEPEGGRCKRAMGVRVEFTRTAEACSSATCLNGTQAGGVGGGAQTRRLRLIEHSNVTRSVPKTTRKGTHGGAKEKRSRACGERKWSRGFSTSYGQILFFPPFRSLWGWQRI